MKKFFKVLFAVAALASMCLMTSTALLAGPEDGMAGAGGKKDDPTDQYCIYQTMSHCDGAGLNYACKITATAEACRRHVCCQPF